MPVRKPVVDAVRSCLWGETRYWSTDARVRGSARTRPFRWTGRGPQRTFFLRRLEESHGSREPVDFDGAAFSIEHLLPQTATPEWLGLLTADVEDGESSQGLHARLVRTIGTLTLNAEKATLANHAMGRKQSLFGRSALRTNDEIAATPGWSRQQILECSDQFADRVVDLWPGSSGDHHHHDAGEGRDWSPLRQAGAAIPTGA